jgi:hypothetical protein
VPSLIDNLVNALYGTITKQVVNRRVQWTIPCDPASAPATVFGIPRNDGEGLLCYFIRAFNAVDGSGTYHGSFVGPLTGNATTATTLQTARSISITGAAVANGVSFDGSANIALNTTITSLPDSSLATISTAGKVANSATTATNANTANSIVARDASGNFSIGAITGSLFGNATTATTLQTARSISITGAAVASGVSFNGSANIALNTTITSLPDSSLATISTAGKVANSATTATNANTANSIVSRDASGNFSIGAITGSLFGNATSATNLAGGSAYSLPYQSAANTTAFLPAGTNGQVLGILSGAIAWVSAPAATTANNLVGGSAGVVPWQSAANTTGFTAAGTSGQILKSNGTSAPTWISQSVIAAGSATTATTATNIASGVAGAMPYQSGVGATAFTAAGTSGQVLTSNGASAPTWASVGVSWTAASTTTTATANSYIAASTTASAWTLTLPASPATGTTVGIIDSGNYWATNNLTIAPSGGNTINGVADNVVCNISNYNILFYYTGTTWRFIV